MRVEKRILPALNVLEGSAAAFTYTQGMLWRGVLDLTCKLGLNGQDHPLLCRRGFARGVGCPTDQRLIREQMLRFGPIPLLQELHDRMGLKRVVHYVCLIHTMSKHLSLFHENLSGV